MRAVSVAVSAHDVALIDFGLGLGPASGSHQIGNVPEFVFVGTVVKLFSPPVSNHSAVGAGCFFLDGLDSISEGRFGSSCLVLVVLLV